MTTTWNIQYARDEHPTIRVHGDFAKAQRLAAKRNKYREAYTITEAPAPDLELDKERARAEARRYGASMRGLDA